MYGWYILGRISKVPFEIPHNISCPYIKRCVFHLDMKNLRLKFGVELVSISETPPVRLVASSYHFDNALKQKYHVDEIVYTGGNGGCHVDNFCYSLFRFHCSP